MPESRLFQQPARSEPKPGRKTLNGQNLQPNVLFITSDQQRGDCFGFEGRKVKTPHLDALARAGTRFSACITPNAVCQPARASILTGLYPRTHGVSDNGIDLRFDIGEAGIGGRFTAANYRTGLIGKAHFSSYYTFAPTGRCECRTSSKDFADDWYGPYMGFQHVELNLGDDTLIAPVGPPNGLHFERWFRADGNEAEKLRLYRTRVPPDVGAGQTWNSALPSAWHPSSWCGDRAVEFLRSAQNRPFMLWVSFADPHHPFDAPDPWSRMHDPAEIDLPVHPERDLDRRPWWHKASLESTPQLSDPVLRRMRETDSRMRPQSTEQLRHIIANYYGKISLIDHNVGRILIALDELGLSENTFVIYTSDHGDWLGDHGLILKGPMMYEGLLRVGCIIKGPSIPAGSVVGEPVSTIDILPTLLDYCSIISHRSTHGKSMRGLIERPTETRDFAYNEWDLHPSRCGVRLHLRTVRTKRHKLTLELIAGAGELYDLADDPFEMENRFADAAYDGVRKELTEMIETRPDDVMLPPPEPIGLG